MRSSPSSSKGASSSSWSGADVGRCGLVLLCLVACGRTDPIDFSPPVFDAGQGAGADAGRADAGGDAGLDAGRSDAGVNGGRDGGLDAGRPDAGVDAGVDAGREPGTAMDDLIYVHDDTALYAWAPATNALTRLASLSCVRPTDLAIDQAGRAFMVAGSTFYRLDLQTGVCTQLATLPEPLNTLQFLPAGIVDALEEGLVGYGPNSYWQFDPRTGRAFTLGSSNLGAGLVPSGDLSALEDGGTFLTVKGNVDAGCADCLVRIDPQTGVVVERLGPIGVGAVWGLATFNDTLYGFTWGGAVFRLDLVDGGVRARQLALVPGRSFWGAAAKPGARSRADGG